ncbi:MAG: glutathione S-transferase family protein [Sphingomonas bacterium]|nr:glutathione S-transferase family protein [Sphingomonas bacterium]
MTGAPITIYHWEPNANSGKPMLAAEEKGVAYDSVYLDMLSFDHHKPDYLAVNPSGTIPALKHGQVVLTESTPMMEYIDEMFDGPPLRPADPAGRWRMRMWMRFLDSYMGPSLSMIGWNIGVGPSVRQKDPKELAAAIDRIPLESRRIAWRKAIYNEFSAEELAESRRRLVYSVRLMEEHLSRTPYLAGDSYSLADVDAFNSCYGLPFMLPEAVDDEQTPALMEWLRTIRERPAVAITWAKSRTDRGARLSLLDRPAKGAAL